MTITVRSIADLGQHFFHDLTKFSTIDIGARYNHEIPLRTGPTSSGAGGESQPGIVKGQRGRIGAGEFTIKGMWLLCLILPVLSL
jgi:hypothetical protein